MAEWPVPDDVADLVAGDADKTWQTQALSPLLLSVMGGTAYAGRPIPLAWQIEFEVCDVSAAPGIKRDGDDWASLIANRAIHRFPELADELRSDSEQSTCVLWVESEENCRKLVEVALPLVGGSDV